VAIPADRTAYGYLSEHHSFGEKEETAGDYAEELAAEMLATTLGVEFDPDKSWDEKKAVYRLSRQIRPTQNITQTAVGDKNALWTTVVAAAVAGRVLSPTPTLSFRRRPPLAFCRRRPRWRHAGESRHLAKLEPGFPRPRE